MYLGGLPLDLWGHYRIRELVRVVANMASYAISSSMILVIHDNMINGTDHIVYHVCVDISRSNDAKIPLAKMRRQYIF
jgi:hypothetical protein